MKLEGKKEFAARVLGVGKGRIIFNNKRLADIKEALTRQDIIDLFNDKAILIREIKGRVKIKRRETRKKAGSRKHSPKKGKKEYVSLTRKFRAYISELRKHNQLSKENYLKIRKEIRARIFNDKLHLKERIENIK